MTYDEYVKMQAVDDVMILKLDHEMNGHIVVQVLKSPVVGFEQRSECASKSE